MGKREGEHRSFKSSHLHLNPAEGRSQLCSYGSAMYVSSTHKEEMSCFNKKKKRRFLWFEDIELLKSMK